MSLEVYLHVDLNYLGGNCKRFLLPRHNQWNWLKILSYADGKERWIFKKYSRNPLSLSLLSQHSLDPL